jgi:hypothetical protein
MLLPPPLFVVLSSHFDHHNAWHVARQPSQATLRATFRGECGDALAGLHEVGSGCDFLRFHRRMMRHFFFVLQEVNYSAFEFRPWPDRRLPGWVEGAIANRYPDFDLAVSYHEIERFVAAGDVENLGGFMEANESWRGSPGASLHNRAHMGLDMLECGMFCGDSSARMKDLGNSPGNVFFWLLHDWIDRRYEECQRNSGEPVDRSPLQMDGHDHAHVVTDEHADLPV